MIDRQSNHFCLREEFNEFDFTRSGRHRKIWKVARALPRRRVLEDNALRLTASKDCRGTQVRRMTKGTLPFNDDHIGIFIVECFEDSTFQLARNKLRRHGVESHAIASALNESRLASAHHHCPNPMIIQSLRQDRGCCSLSNCTICAKHSNPGASDISNAPREHPEVFLRPGHTHISDEHTGSVCGRNELRIFSEELMEPAHDVKTASNGLKNHVALFIRKKAACWGQTNNKNGRVSVPVRKCFIEITDDTNTIRHSIKNHPGIASATRAVDYRSDHIGFALTDKTVRRLPINFSEVSFAIHNSDRSNRNTADAV